MRLLTAVSVIAFLAAGCLGGGGKAGGRPQKRAVVLTLANHEEGDRDVGEFAKAVERLSGGSIVIAVRGRWRDEEIDYDRGTVADVRAGKIALAKIAVRSFDTLGVRDFQPLMAPLLVDSFGLEKKVLASGLATRMLKGVRGLGMEGVAVLPGELRRPFGTARRLLSPHDYRGATVGVRPSLVSSWTFGALGATARGYVPGELPRSFDGAELDLNTIQGNQFDVSGSSFVANVVLWPRAFVVVANKRIFERLTPKQRSILREAGREALEPALDRVRAEEKSNTEILCRRQRMQFLEASPAQLASLRTALRGIYARLRRDANTRAAIDEIEQMKQGVGREAVRSCAARASATAGATPLDGVYEVNTSRGDLISAGAPSRDVIPENYGHWVYVLDRGRIAFTQEDDEACTWAYAKVAVKRETMDWTILDGGYTRAPYRAYNKPGEAFRFGWSLYRETLTLTPAKGPGAPENFRAKPWHRVSTTPSRSYFSKECPPPKEALP